MNNDQAQKLLNEAKRYRDIEQHDKAEQKLRALIKVMPSVAAFWTVLGDTLAELNDWKKSEDAFKKALDLKQDHLSAILGLKNMYCEKGEPERAHKYFKRALEIAPDSNLVRDCIEDYRRFGKLTG